MFVVADHLVDDEAQEFLAEFGIEIGLARQRAQPFDLPRLAVGIGGGQVDLRLELADRLRHLEPFGEHIDERRVDIVDALTVAAELIVHSRLLCGGLVPRGTLGTGGGRVASRKSLQNCRRTAKAAHVMTAEIHQLHGDRPPSLDPMMALVAADMNEVNSVILDRMQSEIPLIPELAGHLIAGGGKRMRPMLTLAGAALCDYQGTRHYKLAAAVEFIHTATLLHDDVVDGSELRRGKATANIVFGNPATVLVGDFLFTRSFELMVEDGSLKVLKILSNASSVISEGEVDQLTAARQIETSEERYLGIIGSKTAALFAAATRIAAVVAEKSETEERALEAYGRNLGIAFQLVDDAMDYDSDAGEMGKGKGDDFREGKMTLPVILAYARGSEEEREFWRAAIAGHRISDDDLAHAVTLIARHDAINATRERARMFAQRAIDAIACFPASEARSAMAEAALFAVARRF